MGSSKRILSLLLLVGGVASSSTSCHAFKPSSSGALYSNRRAAVISNEFILKNDTDTSMPADEVVVRGGHCPEEEGRFHLHRSDALRYHGYLLIYLAVASFIETVGVIIPFLGPTALIPGFNPQDDAMKFVARFSSVIMLSRGLMEIEFSTSEVAQGIFIKIISLMQVITIWTSVEIGAKGIQWIVPALPAIFIIGFLVGK